MVFSILRPANLSMTSDNVVNKLLTNTEVADLQLGEISYAD